MGNLTLRLELALAQGTALAILSTAGCGGTAVTDQGGSAASASSPQQTVAGVAGGGDAPGGPTSSIGGAPAGGRDGIGGSGVETTGGASVGGAEPTIAGAGGEAMVTSLEPYPTAELGCSGESYGPGFGFHGQCCAQAYCYTPSDGRCAGVDDAPDAVHKSYGSGSCLCGPILGAYAPNPTDTPQSAGSCCYIISAIGCDGRPLLVDGRAITSDLSLRADWIDTALLELLRA